MSTETNLKRRNVTSSAISNNDSNKILNNNPNNESEPNENDSIDENNEEYDADSKETRLTLMEEILLLGLKDKEVSNHFFHKIFHKHIF